MAQFLDITLGKKEIGGPYPDRGAAHVLVPDQPDTLPSMTTFLLATGNAHKVVEIRAILGPKFDCLTLLDFPRAPVVVEDGGTFAANAAKKSAELAAWIGRRTDLGHKDLEFVLADDSGLEVDALGGAPGVFSARFAGLDSGETGNSSSEANNAKLLRLLKGTAPEDRTARFRCVVAVTQVGSSSAARTELFDGVCQGRIALEPRGTGGFGYDPLFIPEGYRSTFGELEEGVKNRLSHRARALEKLKKWPGFSGF